ncbi:hypothetical protein PCASD_13535 [Puccinia coronata f. sp. avenae]|uniref:Uncharacterized protein n=1 Tax=Puccinia coronata f. sp. avenae TaxID=200324 RepID=A0A2N5U026_9BASI|nr:hypothetical protein PCASD_13535 [Puccinia coronata f. sp. avenae]
MEASSGRYLTEAPVERYHKASSGRLCQVAPTGRFQKASNGRFNIKAPTPAIMQRHFGLAVILCHSMVARVKAVGSSPVEPSTGRFPDGYDRPSKCCPVRGQPRDGSQATKFWTTNGHPENQLNLTNETKLLAIKSLLAPQWPVAINIKS